MRQCNSDPVLCRPRCPTSKDSRYRQRRGMPRCTWRRMRNRGCSARVQTADPLCCSWPPRRYASRRLGPMYPWSGPVGSDGGAGSRLARNSNGSPACPLRAGGSIRPRRYPSLCAPGKDPVDGPGRIRVDRPIPLLSHVAGGRPRRSARAHSHYLRNRRPPPWASRPAGRGTGTAYVLVRCRPAALQAATRPPTAPLCLQRATVVAT